MYKIVHQLFLSYGNEIHTCAPVKENIEDEIYTTKEALLYQPLRCTLTFKSNRSMIYYGATPSKYDIHIYFHASFLGIAFKFFIDDKDYTAQSVCKNN